MPASSYFEGLILGHALLQEPYSIEDWYVGLWTSDPTSLGDLSGEVQASDYDRRSVSWDSQYVNTNQIDWAAPVNDWGNIVYVVLVNSPNKASGNVLAYGVLPEIFPMPIGQPARIPVGGLQLAA